MKKEYIPSVFTILNLVCGIVSIILVFHGSQVLAAWFIIFAIFFDGIDGKIARLSKATSDFGGELDSLSDIVSSGVAPGLLIVNALNSLGFFVSMTYTVIFISAGAYRLARFNVLQKGDRSIGYIGLPIPISGFIIASFVLFSQTKIINFNHEYFLIFIVPVLSFLMVSKIIYKWPKIEFQQGIFKSVLSIFKLILLFLITIFPYELLFPVFSGYVAYGFISWYLKKRSDELVLKNNIHTE